MTNLQRRLAHLEALLTDTTGLRPHSEEWLEYWRQWLTKRNADPDFRPNERMPLEALRAIIQTAPDSD